jgi:hypothetical protein
MRWGCAKHGTVRHIMTQSSLSPTPAPIWRRWWQPRNPLFWLLVMLNVLNAVIGVMMRMPDQPTVVIIVLGLFGLSNALLSLWLLARLLKPAGAVSAAPPATPL